MKNLYEHIDHAFEIGAPNTDLIEHIAPHLSRIAMGDFPVDFNAITHPLGFESLHLERDGDRAVCLHDWCGCFNEPAPNVVGTEHDHSWDMMSRTLRGNITDTQLEVVTGLYLPAATHFVFDTQTDGVEDTLQFLNEWAVVTNRTPTMYVAGETYGFGKGKPHCSNSSPDLLTLVLARNYPGTPNRSFVPVATADKLVPFPYKQYSILRSPLGTLRTRLLAEHIMEALDIEMPREFASHPDRLPQELRVALPNYHMPGKHTHRARAHSHLILPKGQLTGAE